MPEYRLFEITIEGRIKGPARAIDCEDDQKAVESAQNLVDGFAIEIWELSRLVATVKPHDQPPPLSRS